MNNWTVSPANFAEFKNSFWGGILEEFWGRKNRAKTGHRARFCYQPEKALTSSIHDSPASVQSSDRGHASSGKVQLNQCCSRATKSLHGISVRFHASTRPAQQTTDSHRLPAFASIGNPDSVFDNTDQPFLSVVNLAITSFSSAILPRFSGAILPTGVYP